MKHLMLAAVSVLATVSPALSQPMSPAEYVKTAGAGDLYERTSSQMVLATTANPQLRDFAEMMVAHHTKSSRDIKAAAVKSRVKAAPAKLTPAQTEMIVQLGVEQGAARDATYIAQQRGVHGQALAVHQAYAEGGGAPALKRAAGAVVPVVMQHIEQLKSM